MYFVMFCVRRLTFVSHIAALGALATIMTALTGFFSQQLLQFVDCVQRADTSIAYIARTNNYTSPGIATINLRKLNDQYSSMANAMTVGLISLVDDLTTTFSRGCDSGNCAFPSTNGASFSTLAISHSCKDITDLLTTDNVRWGSGGNSSRVGLNRAGINITAAGQQVLVTSTEVSPSNRYYNLVSSLRSLGTLTLISRPTVDSLNFTAMNCTLFPTVNTYHAEIKNTVLEETLVGSVPLDFNMPGNILDEMNGGDEQMEEFLRFRFTLATNKTLKDGTEGSCAGSKDPTPGFHKHYKIQSELIQSGVIEE
jgi:hypothetical protein